MANTGIVEFTDMRRPRPARIVAEGRLHKRQRELKDEEKKSAKPTIKREAPMPRSKAALRYDLADRLRSEGRILDAQEQERLGYERGRDDFVKLQWRKELVRLRNPSSRFAE